MSSTRTTSRAHPSLRIRTHVDERGGQHVVPAVQPHVDGEEEAHEHLVGKHNQRLHHVEGVPGERRRHGRSVGEG